MLPAYIEELVTFAGEDATPKQATQVAVQEFNAWSAQHPAAKFVQMSTSLTHFEQRDVRGNPHTTFCFILTMLAHTPAGE